MKIIIRGNEAVINDNDDCVASKLIRGCKGKVKVNTPFGKRELEFVDKFKSKANAKKSKAKKAKA